MSFTALEFLSYSASVSRAVPLNYVTICRHVIVIDRVAASSSACCTSSWSVVAIFEESRPT